VTGLGVVLIVIGVLALLNVARGLVGYFASAEDGGIASQAPIGEYLLLAPAETLVPAGVGMFSVIAGVGVFLDRSWGRILAIGVGAATVLAGVLLTLPAIVEWGVPGSFAMLLLPAAFIAFVLGGYVLYAALANRAYLSQ
jgi:hypothetical protein